jgi:Cysteine-rich CPCC
MAETFVNVRGDADAGPYRCPCCGYVTLGERGMYEICAVCFWEDDGQDDHGADQVRGGPNRNLSLTRARRNFERIGATDERRRKFVREPTPAEHPLP